MLESENTPQYEVYRRLRELLSLRRSVKCFHPDAAQEVIYADNALFVILRTDLATGQRLLAVHNVTQAMQPINRPAGSLGRSQAGNIALRMWGHEQTTDEVLRNWLNRLVTRHGWLDMGRKRPIPHESHAAVAGYFYYFGVYYGALCIHALPQSERPYYQHHLARLIIDRQEKDGSWFDYPLYSYHKPYGTAFALLSLQRCRGNDSATSP